MNRRKTEIKKAEFLAVGREAFKAIIIPTYIKLTRNGENLG